MFNKNALLIAKQKGSKWSERFFDLYHFALKNNINEEAFINIKKINCDILYIEKSLVNLAKAIDTIIIKNNKKVA